ncbi:MAG: hydrogenase maturation protease [Synergistetes bacterium]|nr:hydrogenase maturation protease [Synergistota bacterium]
MGYGNYLRKDDGVGIWIGARVKVRFGGEKKVKVLLLHQLMPELIEEFRNARYLIFIDASAGEEIWSLRKIEVGEHHAPLNYVSHTLYPADLLCLLDQIYKNKPESWILSIKGEDFSFGAGLSRRTREIAREVEKLLYSFINSKLKTCMSSL